MFAKEISSPIPNLFHRVRCYLRPFVTEPYSLNKLLGLYIDVHAYEKNGIELEKSYEAVSDVEPSSSLREPEFVFEKVPEQRHCPAQRPLIDIRKIHHGSIADLLAG